MSLIKRSDKGSALTFGELDGNFTHLGGDGTYHNEGVRVGGFRPGEIIETIGTNCEGETIVVHSGTYTAPNCQDRQGLTSAWNEITGSNFSYTPPAGTKKVVFNFEFKMEVASNSGISHYILNIDGTDIPKSARTYASNYASTNWHHGNMSVCLHYVFDLTAESDDPARGKFASWTTPKTIKAMAREYSSSYQVTLHSNEWWDGGGAGSTHDFTRPLLTITAIA